jgi:hypothetical protein
MGGYKATAQDLEMLRKYKRGVSIGFTGRSSLRAKGLLPRVSRKYRGTYVLGPKYSGTGQDRVLDPHTLKVSAGLRRPTKTRRLRRSPRRV